MKRCDEVQDQIYQTIVYSILMSFGLFVMAITIQLLSH